MKTNPSPSLKMYVCCLVILFLSGAATAQDAYKEYCNARFQYCISYPADFVGEGESANGDGQVFYSPDRAVKITGYGSLVLEEEDLGKLSRQYTFSAKGIKVSYKVMKPDWFIFSGTDTAGNIVYQKTIRKKVPYMGQDDLTPIFQTWQNVYPASRQEQYKAYCALLAKKLQ